MDTSRLKDMLARIRTEVEKVIIGQRDAIDMALITIITGNHALIEGVPGVAKTLLVRTLAKICGCDSQRIQFTPDLMPADITGTNVYNLKDNQFKMIKGPVFTTFLLADEINRAPAKTQSALLQAMQERKVTIDRETYDLSDDFTVFATQNPIEFEGTYPLPEAQKDRFMLKIPMKAPAREEELLLADRMMKQNSPESVLESDSVLSVIRPGELQDIKRDLSAIEVKQELLGYMVDIVRMTRTHSSILVGAGPRATQALLAASQAYAAIRDNDFVSPDDIKDVALPVLSHRIILRPEFEIEGLTVEEVIQQILTNIPIPR